MALAETWKWDAEAFVKAWEAGVFGDQRVELVEGEVWPVTIGTWHGAVAMKLARSLPNDKWHITGASLPSSGSLPDPDVWVGRAEAQPIGRVGNRVAKWDADDVVLVVEVSDRSFLEDTTKKVRTYGSAGYSTYWVVHRGGVEEFTEPYADGYRQRRTYSPGDAVPVPYAEGQTITVDGLLDVHDAG